MSNVTRKMECCKTDNLQCRKRCTNEQVSDMRRTNARNIITPPLLPRITAGRGQPDRVSAARSRDTRSPSAVTSLVNIGVGGGGCANVSIIFVGNSILERRRGIHPNAPMCSTGLVYTSRQISTAKEWILINKQTPWLFSPHTNYTGWATAAGQRILVPISADRAVSRGHRNGFQRPLISVF
jgi:hypothetical protein